MKTSLVAFFLLPTEMDMQKYWFHKGFAQNRGAMYDDGRLPPLLLPLLTTTTHTPTHPQKYILILHPTPPRSPLSLFLSRSLSLASILPANIKAFFLEKSGEEEKKKAELGP